MLTENKLIKMNIGSDWLSLLNNGFEKNNISNKTEAAMFLSQLSHETKNFTQLEESFNYTPERLFEVFKARIKTIEKAKELVKQGHKAIANFVYNGRMDNNYNTNDGYNYRGRGLIHLTGRENYKKYGDKLNIDLINNPDLAKEKDNAVLIALLFWIENKCSIPAKLGDIMAVTKIINGGVNGLSNRIDLFSKYKKILES